MSMITLYVPLSAEEAGALLAEPAGVDDLVEALMDDPERAYEIDKAWHGIHFVLTGSAEPVDGPVGDVVLGGREVGDDMGYGPARVLSPDQVKRASQVLRAIDEGAFSRRYNAEALRAADVYPAIWDAEALDYLLEYYRGVREIFEEAASDGGGMLVALT